MPVVVPSGSTPAPIRDAKSFDGRVRAVDDPKFGGVRIKVDYSYDLSSWSSPFQCTVYRVEADGSVYTVRGGNPYVNYTGKGWLYDQEVPLGQSVSYYAVPILARGSAPAVPTPPTGVSAHPIIVRTLDSGPPVTSLTGPQSGSASITTSVPAGGFANPDMWLVNLEDPSASVQARGTTTLVGNYNGRNDKQVALGSPYPVVTPDSRNGLGTQISVLTSGQQEFAAMQKLLLQSVIMRKSSLWERPDGYFTVDDVSYTTQAASTGRGLYVWQLTLVEVNRPSTYGQTVANPNFTFASSETQSPLFSDTPSMTFDAVQGGNMLDLATSGYEAGSSPWYGLFGGNTTVSTEIGIVYRGSRSVGIKATAPGVFGAYPSPRLPVIAGTTYTFSAWVYSQAGLVVDIGFDWKDGAGGYLRTDSLANAGRAVTLTPNTWTQVILSATPSPGAQLVSPVVKPTATAAGQMAFIDSVSVENF